MTSSTPVFFKIKLYEDCHDSEEWCTIGKELTCCFKSDKQNLTNFDPSTRNSQKSVL